MKAVMEKLSERVHATKGKAVLRSRAISLAAREVDNDTFLQCEALGLIDCDYNSTNQQKLRARHA